MLAVVLWSDRCGKGRAGSGGSDSYWNGVLVEQHWEHVVGGGSNATQGL